MKANIKNIYDEIITTFFFIGKIKFAPGSIASIFPLLFLYIPLPLRLYLIGLLVVTLFIFSLNSIKRMELKYGNDAPQIVIDEIIGMLLVLFTPYVVFGYIWAILAFGFFRLFDIFKPFPINIINNKKGSAFVILDDVLAAVYTWITIHCIYQLSNIFGIYYIITHLMKQ